MREALSQVWFLPQSEVRRLYENLFADGRGGRRDPKAIFDSLSHALRMRIEQPEAFKDITDFMGLKDGRAER